MSLSLTKLFKKVSKNLNPTKSTQPEPVGTTNLDLDDYHQLREEERYRVTYNSFNNRKAKGEMDGNIRLNSDFEEAIQRLHDLQLINNTSSKSESIERRYVASKVDKNVYGTATKFVNPPNLNKVSSQTDFNFNCTPLNEEEVNPYLTTNSDNLKHDSNRINFKANTNFSRLPTSYCGSTQVSNLASTCSYNNSSYHRRLSKPTVKYASQSLGSYSFLSDRTNTPYATSPKNSTYLQKQRTRSSSISYIPSYPSSPSDDDDDLPSLGIADTDRYFKQNYSFDTYCYSNSKRTDLTQPLPLPSSPISIPCKVDTDDTKLFELNHPVQSGTKVNQPIKKKVVGRRSLSLSLNTNEEQLGVIPNFKVKLLDPLPKPTFLSTQVKVWNSGVEGNKIQLL